MKSLGTSFIKVDVTLRSQGEILFSWTPALNF